MVVVGMMVVVLEMVVVRMVMGGFFFTIGPR